MKERIYLLVTPSQKDKLKEASQQLGIPVNKIIRYLITQFIETYEGAKED